jgi:hypothetical protein
VKLHSKISAVASAIALVVLPAAALAQGGPVGNHGKSQAAPGHTKSSSQPGPGATTTAKTKAYGRYCQGESKKHVAGQPGTPFSDCVNDMAQLSKSMKANPHRVCANESKKQVSGQSGTPYSQCVSAAAKLRHDQKESTGSATPTTGTSGSGTTGS